METITYTYKPEDIKSQEDKMEEAVIQAGKCLGIETELGKKCFYALCEAAVLLDRKNKDYGPGNISAFGEKGVIVRLNDKIERLKTLVWNDRSPEHEKVSDTWLDVTNYGIIGLLCHRGDWK